MKNDNVTSVEGRIAVVGAGISGLSAAVLLAEAGCAVTLIEARHEVGGRMRSLQPPGFAEPVELGAEFIHGVPRDLLDLIEDSGLHTYEVGGTQYCWDGRRISRCDGERDFRIMDDLTSYEGANMSFREFLCQRKVSKNIQDALLGYIEGFNAAEADTISVLALARQQKAEDAIEGARAFHVREGYTAVARALQTRFERAGGTCKLGHTVQRIQWRSGRVDLDALASSGQAEKSRFERVILTLPLGVWKQQRGFLQPWPDRFNAIDQMEMGTAHRVALAFRSRFWAEAPLAADDLHFLFAEGLLPRVWWTSLPSDIPYLTAWIGGTSAKGIDAQAFAELALRSAALIFGRSQTEMAELMASSHFHDWSEDPLSLGAYSYVKYGGVDASKNLSMPVADTLFMAGEHTDVTGHWGTVHGALRSGIRAGRQVLETIHR